MFKPKSTQERILHRFKIIQGHLRKVVKMASENAYCIDVIHQSQAVQNALDEVNQLIMKNHLETCAADAIKKGRGKEAIAEIMSVLRKVR